MVEFGYLVYALYFILKNPPAEFGEEDSLIHQ